MSRVFALISWTILCRPGAIFFFFFFLSTKKEKKCVHTHIIIHMVWVLLLDSTYSWSRQWMIEGKEKHRPEPFKYCVDIHHSFIMQSRCNWNCFIIVWTNKSNKSWRFILYLLTSHRHKCIYSLFPVSFFLIIILNFLVDEGLKFYFGVIVIGRNENNSYNRTVIYCTNIIYRYMKWWNGPFFFLLWKRYVSW